MIFRLDSPKSKQNTHVTNVRLYIDKKSVGKYIISLYEGCILLSSKLNNLPAEFVIKLTDDSYVADKKISDGLNINLLFNFKLYTIRLQTYLYEKYFVSVMFLFNINDRDGFKHLRRDPIFFVMSESKILTNWLFMRMWCQFMIR